MPESKLEKLVAALPDELPPAPSHAEIQFAHDVLSSVILDEDVQRLIIPKDQSDLERMTAACDVLCWVLGHEENPAFGENLAGLIQTLLAAGYRPRPIAHGKAKWEEAGKDPS